MYMCAWVCDFVYILFVICKKAGIDFGFWKDKLMGRVEDVGFSSNQWPTFPFPIPSWPAWRPGGLLVCRSFDLNQFTFYIQYNTTFLSFQSRDSLASDHPPSTQLRSPLLITITFFFFLNSLPPGPVFFFSFVTDYGFFADWFLGNLGKKKRRG